MHYENIIVTAGGKEPVEVMLSRAQVNLSTFPLFHLCDIAAEDFNHTPATDCNLEECHAAAVGMQAKC